MNVNQADGRHVYVVARRRANSMTAENSFDDVSVSAPEVVFAP